MQPLPAEVDVVVVGGGLSGIGAACRLQQQRPGTSFVVLEARDALGGTWDLFRYPGVRSDSDMFTLSYPFEPWRREESIADGPDILAYLRQTAERHRIADAVRLRSRVVDAAWCSRSARWTLTVERGDPGAEAPHAPPRRETVTCRFVYWCTGYYDYTQPHAPELPGRERFPGPVVHPQFWPEDLAYEGKRVVVIGSGATAVTLVPALAERAAHVTMLQRTPSWLASTPRIDRWGNRIRERLGHRRGHAVVRAKNAVLAVALYQLARLAPRLVGRLLLSGVRAGVGEDRFAAPDYTPPYRPWDQRLCLTPDGEFFRAVRRGRASVVTGTIDTLTEEGVALATGETLPADVVVTATGLRLQLLGGVRPTVDGAEVDLAQQRLWRGLMLTGLPNLALCAGYTNASWTLRADLSSRLVCRVLDHLDAQDLAAVVPETSGDVGDLPLLNLTSGYVRRALPELPRQGRRGVWRVRQNYLVDALVTRRTDLRRTLRGIRHPAVDGTAPDPSDLGLDHS